MQLQLPGRGRKTRNLASSFGQTSGNNSRFNLRNLPSPRGRLLRYAVQVAFGRFGSRQPVRLAALRHSARRRADRRSKSAIRRRIRTLRGLGFPILPAFRWPQANPEVPAAGRSLFLYRHLRRDLPVFGQGIDRSSAKRISSFRDQQEVPHQSRRSIGHREFLHCRPS